MAYIRVNNIIKRINDDQPIAESLNISYSKPSDASAATSSLTNVTNIKQVLDWMLQNWSTSGSTPVTQYTVTFNVNGGSGSAPANQTKNAGSQITLPSYSGSKSGYTFGGWNTNASGTGNNYSVGASYTVNGNVTLYAKWVANQQTQYTVNFNTNGGSSCNPITANAGDTITLPNTSRDGYMFNGWNTDASGTGINYSAGASYTVNDNITLHAKWIENQQPQYTIRCNVSNGSKYPNDNQTATNGESVYWDIIPNSGYKMPTSISNATINGNRVTVEYANDNITIYVNCIPELRLESSDGSIQRPKGSLRSIAAVGGSDDIRVTVGSTTDITKPTSLTLNYDTNTNKTADTPTATYDGSNVTPTWISSNTSVATVSGTRITAIGAGSTTLTATYNGETASYELTVINESTSESVTSGWTYTSTNTNIATISGITVTGVAQGSTHIKVNYEGKTCDLSGTVTVDADAPQATYYWYVGTTLPTDPTNPNENEGNNVWTSLGSTLPTTHIKVSKEDANFNTYTWYIAAPTDANFTLYNATNAASSESGYNKSTFNIGSISYTLWTSKNISHQAVGYLHK